MLQDALRSTWGRGLKAAREAAGLSIRGLAVRTGLHPSHLARVERGEAGLGDANRVTVAAALGHRVEDLFPYPDFKDNHSCPSADSAEVRGSSPTPATPADRRSGALSAEVPDASGRAANRGSEVA